MRDIILLLLLLVSINAKYLDSKSCNECHENIYYEHSKSMHSNSSLFKDEFHRKMKERNFPKSYKCSVCHIPAANDLDKISSGKYQPSHTKRQLDGVSCAYCHSITAIRKSHTQNSNKTTLNREGKLMVYGMLNNPGESDKHDSLSLPKRFNIFANSKVCMGCHSHKRNDSHDVEVCQVSSDIDNYKQTDCIGCHMPKFPGDLTKINKKGRLEYASHEFLGIRSDEMIKKAVKLSIKKIDNTHIKLIIKNKMGHQILLQPMRLKYVKTTITRDDKIIWSNFKNSPYEDKEVTFSKLFIDDNGKQVYPPKASAIKYYTNLDTFQSKDVIYEVPKLQNGDEIKSVWISYPIRPTLAQKLDITDLANTKKYIGNSIKLKIK
jgi:hypothetical protein